MNILVKFTTLLANLIIIVGGVFVLYTQAPHLFTTKAPELAIEVADTDEEKTDTEEAENTKSKDEIDLERERLIEKWSDTGLTGISSVIEKGEAVLSNQSSTVTELKEAADQANAASNFVGYILEEYQEYYRDNYKYSFIQSKVAPAHDEYVEKANALRRIRNESFFRIGEILESEGKLGPAFFYYRDAFRLTKFDDRNAKKNGLRYRAEQKMKAMLGLDEIDSYVTWK